jgi:GT2 family glycosyltransferase
MITIAYWSPKKKKKWEAQILNSAGFSGLEVIANHDSNISFSKFYNHVLDIAKNDVVVFIDTHIEIKSEDWAKTIIDEFEKEDIGIIAVCGSLGLPPSGCWWENHDLLVGRVWFKEKEHLWETKYSEVMPGRLIDVICADGLFMAVHKSRIKNKFDESFYNHYFFDVDFTFTNHLAGVNVAITFDIEVVIYQIEYDKKVWEANRLIFKNKYPQLPYLMTPQIILHNHHIEIPDGPKISIIISTKKASIELFSTLESIYEKSLYLNREIIIVDQSGSKQEQKKIKEFIKNHRDTRILTYKKRHLPSIYNEIAMFHLAKDSELVLFCRDNIILINDAITRMVQTLLENRHICGTVGARLHFANNFVRHFGLQLITMDTEEGLALGISHQGIKSCYAYQNNIVKNILGSSKDFLLISREVFAKVGGFNTNYQDGLEDCELNLRCILLGRINFMAGDAVCYHLEEDLPTFRMQDYERLANLIDDYFDRLSPYFEQVYAS